MKIGVLGTGVVGQNIATKFASLGNEVMLGSRSSNNEKGLEWKKANGDNASIGTFAETAHFGEIIFNCTKGENSIEAIRAAGKENLKGKILVDLANPLDFSKGMPPGLLLHNDSLGEQIQRELPDTHVVKTLNTINYKLMTNPSLLHGDHTIFISGNSNEAKATVSEMIKRDFGWKSITDLGDIKTARGTEAYVMLWAIMYGKFQSPDFNINIVKG